VTTASAVLMVVLAAVTLWRLPALHPAQLWALAWAAAVVLFALELLPYRTPADRTWLLIDASTLGFVGAALAGRPLAKRIPWRPRWVDGLPYAAAGLTLLTAVWLVAFLVEATVQYGVRATLVTSVDVRRGIQEGALSVSVKYVYVALAAAAVCGAMLAYSSGRRPWALAALFVIGSTYFSTGRATVVMAMVIALAGWAMCREEAIRRRWLVVGAGGLAVAAIAVIAIVGSLIGKTFENTELATIRSVFTETRAIKNLAVPYQHMTAPIASLDVQVAARREVPPMGGCATLESACTVLRSAGLDAEPYPRIRPFTARPLRWNTYTALEAPLLDGGERAVVPVIAVFGLLAGLLWTLARLEVTVARLLYAVTVPAILSSVGANNFTAPQLLGAAAAIIAALLAGQRLAERRERAYAA